MKDSSHKYMVLTAVGPDQPGLVKEVASLIHQAGGNLEDSRMAVLAGEFALIVLFSGPEETVARVQEGRARLEQQYGFSLSFKPTAPPAASAEHQAYFLEVTGVDQPGIVHQVSQVLADHAVNVTSLESRLPHAAFSGTPLFFLKAELQVFGKNPLTALRERLDDVCGQLNLSCVLEPR